MAASRALIWAALLLLVGTAHAARGLRESLMSQVSERARGLLQVGGAGWGSSTTRIDDGARTGYSQYAAVSGYSEIGNPYGYYGSGTAASAFANANAVDAALSRNYYPSNAYLGNRARIGNMRFGSRRPYDLY